MGGEGGRPANGKYRKRSDDSFPIGRLVARANAAESIQRICPSRPHKSERRRDRRVPRLYRSLRRYVHSRRSHMEKEREKGVFKHRARTLRTIRIRLAFARRGNANVSLAFENVVIQDYSSVVNYLADSSSPPSSFAVLRRSARDRKVRFAAINRLSSGPRFLGRNRKYRQTIVRSAAIYSP